MEEWDPRGPAEIGIETGRRLASQIIQAAAAVAALRLEQGRGGGSHARSPRRSCASGRRSEATHPSLIIAPPAKGRKESMAGGRYAHPSTTAQYGSGGRSVDGAAGDVSLPAPTEPDASSH